MEQLGISVTNADGSMKDSVTIQKELHDAFRGLLEHFVTEHNKCVEKQKQFTVGDVTVVDNNDYVSYSCSSYSMTMDAIREKLINTHGGYLRLRYTPDGKVLDYLADFTEASLQKVEYGKNLTDVKITYRDLPGTRLICWKRCGI